MRKPLVLVPLAAIVVVLGSVSLPAYSVGPGPVREVAPRIQVSGAETFPSKSRFVLTSVVVDRVTPIEALLAWLDDDRSVVPESSILGPGETEEEGERRAVSQMDQSTIDASYVVLTELGDQTGYPEEHGSGVMVEQVVDGCPAEGRLYPGDVIEFIDGTAVRDVDHFAELLEGAEPGRPIRIEVEVDGEREEVSLTPRPCAGESRPLVGIRTLAAFPFEVAISTGDIGGPSAGLMWALGLYDLLTPGDLAGGRTVAGTGAIDLAGGIGPIGGIEQKIAAARRADADVFLVPSANLEAALGVAGDLPLVPVSSLDQALEYLQGGG
jgi:Lon-like protease